MINESKIKCQMCGRLLNDAEDKLSTDCGGDCWGCVGLIEAENGFEPSILKVLDEVKSGVRPK